MRRNRCHRLWIVALVVSALCACDRVGPHEGYAVLDPAVYASPEKDALPVEVVVRPAAARPARPPNLVIVLADDLGYGDLGVYGNASIRTPHLDAMARAGVRFTHFYSADSTCSASRAGLMTGRYALRSGMGFPLLAGRAPWFERMLRPVARLTGALGMVDIVQANPPPVTGLPASEITLAEALRSAGYATGMIGKWHLGDFSADPRHHPSRHGFDVFAGFPHSNDLFPYSYWEDENEIEPEIGLRQADLTATLTRKAIEFVDASRDRPFFLYFAHKNVHTPLFPAPAFAGRSAAGPYGDSVEELDASVGELLAALAARGLLEDTLVVFMSDNGPWHLGSPGALRGRKGQALEGGQRVPAIAQWAGRLAPGRVVHAPVSAIDLFPTFLTLAGLEPPSDRVLDGRDLGPLLDASSEASPHDALFFFNANTIDGVRSDRWKYYRMVHLYTWPTPLDKVSTLAGRWAHANVYADPRTGERVHRSTHDALLFDVVADPGEAYDVGARHPDEARRLDAEIESWERDFFANPRGWR